ncbi:MAG TPA: hypothetical protein VF591_01560 [Pyrinomonadaceae bacterium]
MTMLLLSLIGGAAAAAGSQKTDRRQLRLVQKIYVAEVGTGEEGAKFREVLRQKLAKKGFKLAETEQAADGILSGTLALDKIESGTSVKSDVELKSPAGERLWGAHFSEKRVSTFSLAANTKPLSSLADKVVKALHGDWTEAKK